MINRIFNKIKTALYTNVSAFNIALTLSIAAFMSLYSMSASAQSSCMPREVGLQQLAEHNQVKVFTGLVVVNGGREQLILEMYVNVEENSMMLMETSTAQIMCLKRHGVYYEIHDVEIPGLDG